MKNQNYESLTALREKCQALGVEWSMGMTREVLKAQLLAKLNEMASPPVQADVPEPDQLRTVPPAKHHSQQEIADALKPYEDVGLILKFPTADTWEIHCNGRKDSGNVRIPLRVINLCAQALIRK